MTIRLLKIMIISFGLWLCNCAGPDPDTRLVRIEEMASVSPEEALDSLKAIQYDKLKPADRHYYDFLSVKVPDKAYVHHTSDSLILKVIDYEKEHRGDGRYAESLYYGGRVYSDLGDYPTALQNFHNAVEELKDAEDNKSLELKTRILSQTGRLLNSMRLYDEAVKYVEEALEIEKHLNDTVKIANDQILLGGIYLRNDEYDKAINTLKSAILYCKDNKSLSLDAEMYIAASEYKLGNIDIALQLIRNKPEQVDSINRTCALAHASNIYLKAGLLDTAYMYAKELIRTRNTYSSTGFNVLLDPKMRKNLHPDSIDVYINDYTTVLESNYDQNKALLTIDKEAVYNYKNHQKHCIKAEKSNILLQELIIGLIILILLLTVLILVIKNRNKNSVIRLQRALEEINQLEKSLKDEKVKNLKVNPSEKLIPHVTENPRDNIEVLRKNLRDKLFTLYKEYSSNSKNVPISPILTNSSVYRTLEEHISKKSGIKEDSELWKELEDLVLVVSPNFRYNLQLLLGGKLKSFDLHTALLIKCGFQPSEMTILLNRAKSSISSRREAMCARVFDETMRPHVIDAIIRLL